MKDRSFDWSSTRQLTWPQILLAVFLPSGLAFAGFHIALPWLVHQGMPPLLAWPLVASIGLLLLVLIALALLRREARTLQLDLLSRACITRVSKQRWLLYIALALLVLILSAVLQPTLPRLWSWFGFQPPTYYPFFLRGIDPTTASMAELSPGLPIYGAFWLLPIMALTLLLNILAEELYFRAWLMPKMHWLGKWAWFWNGTLFALYHTFQIWLLPVILIASLVFAFVIWHSRSIVPAMALHLVLNFLFTIVGMTALIMQQGTT